MQFRGLRAVAHENAQKTRLFVNYSSTDLATVGFAALLRGVFSACRWVLVLTRFAISRIRTRCLFCGRKRGDFDNGSLSAFLGCELV
jgi:hypothetical protein